MDNILFLSINEIISIHQNQIELFGGSHGVRDHGLLASAINMPSFGMFGAYVHADIFEMGAAYAYHIIKNHPFVDGNKRTGMAATLLFLRWNDVLLTITDDTVVNLGVKIAESKLSKEEVAHIFRQSCTHH